MTNKEKVKEIQSKWASRTPVIYEELHFSSDHFKELWDDLHRLIGIFEKCELSGEYNNQIKGTIKIGGK